MAEVNKYVLWRHLQEPNRIVWLTYICLLYLDLTFTDFTSFIQFYPTTDMCLALVTGKK
jgi:hypothetical protein